MATKCPPFRPVVNDAKGVKPLVTVLEVRIACPLQLASQKWYVVLRSLENSSQVPLFCYLLPQKK